MILIQIGLTIIAIIYCLAIPTAFVHECACRYLENHSNPIISTIKEADYIAILWWIIIGLFIVGGAIELWKI